MAVNYFGQTTIGGYTFTDKASGLTTLTTAYSGSGEADIFTPLVNEIALFSIAYRVIYRYSWRMRISVTDSLPASRKMFDGNPPTYNYGYYSAGLVEGLVDNDLIKYGIQWTPTYMFIAANSNRRYLGDPFVEPTPVFCSRIPLMNTSPLKDAYDGSMIETRSYADFFRWKANAGVSLRLDVLWQCTLVDYDSTNSLVVVGVPF